MGYTKSGELCVDKVINPKLYKKLNQEYPHRMREMGWDIEDCTTYDTEKAKSYDRGRGCSIQDGV